MVFCIVQEEEQKTATQYKGVILPIKQSISTEPEARAITEEEKKFNAFNAICQVRKISTFVKTPIIQLLFHSSYCVGNLLTNEYLTVLQE